MAARRLETGVSAIMLPIQITEQWRALSVSDDARVQALSTDLRTLARWCAGETYPRHGSRQRLAALAALHTHLLDTFETSEAARAWLHAGSRYLGGLTPLDALRAGRLDRMEAALAALDSGVFV